MPTTTKAHPQQGIFQVRNGGKPVFSSKRDGKQQNIKSEAIGKSSEEFSDRCNDCQRVFRDSEHFAKHKRGALCRRLTQRVARKHRKLVLSAKKDGNSVSHVQNGSSSIERVNAPTSAKKKTNTPVYHMYKPYQCNVCGARFYDKVNVELHLERQHHTNQQLWVEVSKIRTNNVHCNVNSKNNMNNSCLLSTNEALRINTAEANSTQSSSSNSYSGNTDSSVTNCLDISNNNSQIFTNNERLKCVDCNNEFSSDVELNEHKRIHHSLTNSMDSGNLSQTVHNSSSMPRNIPNVYINNNSAPNCGAVQDNQESASSHNKNMVVSVPANSSPNQQQLTPQGYIFPSGYFGNDPSTSLHQPGIHPHAHPFLGHPQQHQHHHHQQQQQTVMHASHLHQHHDHDLSGHQHHNNSLMHAHHGGVHHNGSQFQPTLTAPAPSQFNSVPIVPQPSQEVTNPHLVSLGPIPVNTSEAMTLSNNSAIPINNNSGINDSNHDLSSSLPQESSVNFPSTSSQNCDQASAIASCSIGSQRSSVQSKSSSGPSNDNQDRCKQDKNVSSYCNAKWNMCGECGIKFLDLMNLELHVERRHPHLKILGSVVLGEGTVCYKTGIVTHKGSSKSSSLTKELSKDGKITQQHTCSICNHRTSSLVPMVDHMANVHYLTGKNMMNAIVSKGESNDLEKSVSSSISGRDSTSDEAVSGNKNSVKSQKSAQETVKQSNSQGKERVPDTSNQCHSCLAIFKTPAEVIRHSIKDKKHTCVVCCFVTCSKHELFDHMKSEHQNWNDFHNLTSAGEISSSKDKLTCFKCSEEFRKTGDLLEHLKTHGSLSGKCEKCGKQDYNVASILIHMTTLHPDYMNKIKISVMMRGKTHSGIYTQTLSGDLIDVTVFKTSKTQSGSELVGESNNVCKPVVSKNKLKKRSSESSSSSSTQKKSSLGDSKKSDNSKVYACSSCLLCLYDAKSLQVHLKEHQESGSQGVLTSKHSNDHQDRVGLKVLNKTKGFQCEECGILKKRSDILINHIKKRHISGNLLHLVQKDDGSVKKHPIYIVTPISSVE